MNNEDIVKYCTTSPENINPAVLRSMLSSVEGGGGGSSALIVGWHLDEGGVFKIVLDKTWNEIHDAMADGVPVFINCTKLDGVSTDVGMIAVLEAVSDGQVYFINCYNYDFWESDPDNYPSMMLD